MVLSGFGVGINSRMIMTVTMPLIVYMRVPMIMTVPMRMSVVVPVPLLVMSVPMVVTMTSAIANSR